ncbi:MAG: SemiSWEET transporter [Chitinophagaceae bacterium]|nr:SemiSWEET transporter [Chitinophagaceae bacterium]
MDSANIVGYIASAVTVFTFLPQVIKTWKEKSAKNVSLLMFIIAIVNEVLWIAYGVMRDDMVIILTNIVMMCMASLMIYLKLRYKNA